MSEERVGPALQALVVLLTARCNLACRYCWQTARSPRAMSWPTLRAAVDLLLASPSNAPRLTFSGGEPLLERELLRRAVERVERRRRPGQNVRIGLFTNGTLLDDATARFLVDHDLEVQLSFDGVPAAQALRGAGTFARLDRLLDRLRSTHPTWYRRRLSVAAMVTPETVAKLPASVRYFLDREVRKVIVAPCLTGLSGWEPERIGEIESSIGEVFDLCEEHFQRTGSVPVNLVAGGSGVESSTVPGRAICGAAGVATLTVDADGQLYGCPLFAESTQELPAGWLGEALHTLRLGDVRSPGLERRRAEYPEAAERAGMFHHPERRYSSFGACVECEHRGACHVCPVAAGHLAGNDDPHRVPDFLCAVNRVRLDLLRRRPPLPDLAAVLRGEARVPRRFEALYRAFAAAGAPGGRR